MSNLKLIIFDLDGTLVDSEKVYHQGWVQVLKDYGHEANELELKAMRGRSTVHNNQIIKGYLGSDRLVQEARSLREEYYFTALKNGQVELLPGAMEIIETAKNQSLKLAVATSSYGERAIAMLEKFDLLKHFDFTVFGDEVVESKPSPEIYERALELANISAKHAIAIEDSTAGLESALAANLRVCFVPEEQVERRQFESNFTQFSSLTAVQKELFG